MKSKKFHLPALLMAGMLGDNVLAAQEAGTNDISDQAREMMMSGAQKYDQCLQEQAQAMFNEYEDVRQLADQAMVKCRPTLAELEQNLKDQKLDPGLTAGYVRHARDSAVRHLLPRLMAAKAQAGNAAGAAATGPKSRN
ncbi:MAG TPA: hypothetical protein VMH34_05200 [Gammaproteobacteria bacterium]|nr:hypothetical protein [Gammaproteobacteria bacterium]